MSREQEQEPTWAQQIDAWLERQGVVLPGRKVQPTGQQLVAASLPTGEEDLDDGPPVSCWCGAEGTYSQLFDDSGLEGDCGGLGVINCFCGGDFCVCHHHGEVECPGCPACENEDDEEFWEDADL
jgi:hypothetical protein